MFNYLKQALDSVENQLDTILDPNLSNANEKPTEIKSTTENRIPIHERLSKTSAAKSLKQQRSNSELISSVPETADAPQQVLTVEPEQQDNGNKVDLKESAAEIQSEIPEGIEKVPSILPNDQPNVQQGLETLIPTFEKPNEVAPILPDESKDEVPSTQTVPIRTESDEAMADLLAKREKQLLESKTENANLNNQIHELEKQIELLQSQKDPTYLTAQLKEKEASIKGLLQEGEALSKNILRLNNSVKKYKKQNESLTKELQETKDTTGAQIQSLTASVQTLTDTESEAVRNQ